MKILYVGNFTYPFCTEVHLTRELEGLGHEVERFQEPPGGGNLETIDQIGRAAIDKQLVIWQRTWGLPDALTVMWRELEACGVVTASYHLDLYVGLPRQPRVYVCAEDEPQPPAGEIVIDPFWTTQHVFSADGDPHTQRWLEDRGVHHHWMPAGVVSDACAPGTADPRRFPHPVVFVGSAYENYHPEWTHRRDLMQHLERTYGQQFHRHGGEARRGPIREQALNDLYATATVVVGDSYCPMIQCEICHGSGVLYEADGKYEYADAHEIDCRCVRGQRRQRNYWSDRPYETIGRGGFLIHPRVPGLEEHFTDGEHLVFYEYGDFDELDWHIERALADPARARQIAMQGQQHVSACHTYRHRLASALEVMGLT